MPAPLELTVEAAEDVVEVTAEDWLADDITTEEAPTVGRVPEGKALFLPAPLLPPPRLPPPLTATPPLPVNSEAGDEV